MNDFDYDVKQKKSIARGAYARKGGSKSKKCSLPSDLLTPAQKRKLNGPCDSVKLDEPMTWERFKDLPLSLAKEYVTNLRETYGATQKMFAQMFGVSPPFLSKTFGTMGFSSLFSKSHGSVEENRIRQAKWDAFCNGVVGGSNLIIEDANDQIETANDQIEIPDLPVLDTTDVPDLTEEVCKSCVDDSVRSKAPTATNLCATFNGFPDLATLETFYRLVGTDKVKVTINIEVMDHA